MQLQLCVRKIAEGQALRLGDLQRSADVPMATMRRYWYASSTGLERDSGTLHEVSLHILVRIATALQVAPGDLFCPVHEEGGIPCGTHQQTHPFQHP